MPEFRKLEGTPPMMLGRDDMEALAAMVEFDLEPGSRVGEFAVTWQRYTQKEATFAALLREGLPDDVDDLTFSVLGRSADGRVDRGVTVVLQKRWGYYQVHAADRAWFDEKCDHLAAFFRSRRVWYSSLRAPYPYLSVGLSVALIFVGGYLFRMHAPAAASAAWLAVAANYWLFGQYFAGSLFPQNTLAPNPRPRRADKALVVLFLAAFLAAGALLAAATRYLSVPGTQEAADPRMRLGLPKVERAR